MAVGLASRPAKVFGRGRARALRHVIKEPVDLAAAGPFRPQAGPLFCAPQGRQQPPVHLPGVCPVHDALHMQPARSLGDRPRPEHLGKHRDNGGLVVRAHLTSKPELSHQLSLSWQSQPEGIQLYAEHATKQPPGGTCARLRSALPMHKHTAGHRGYDRTFADELRCMVMRSQVTRMAELNHR